MADRADVMLCRLGLAKSRTHAAELIRGGLARADGAVIKKPAQLVDDGSVLAVDDGGCPYVSRGGLKLQAALEVFSVDPTGLTCADIGASTGGFTDCLLKHGAARVYALDVGTGQLDARLLCDPRVVNFEKINARSLDATLFEPVDLAVMDVSFISQTLIYRSASSILKDGGRLISLIKPQFELGRQAIGRGGIVKNAKEQFPMLCDRLKLAAAEHGLELVKTTPSPITGGDGNHEYLALFVK